MVHTVYRINHSLSISGRAGRLQLGQLVMLSLSHSCWDEYLAWPEHTCQVLCPESPVNVMNVEVGKIGRTELNFKAGTTFRAFSPHLAQSNESHAPFGVPYKRIKSGGMSGSKLQPLKFKSACGPNQVVSWSEVIWPFGPEFPPTLLPVFQFA